MTPLGITLRLLHAAGLLGPAYRVRERLWSRSLDERRAAEMAGAHGDGWPVPPSSLLVAIGGLTSVAAYLEGGRATAAAIRGTLAAHGLEMERLAAILDFGCGCGRVLRQWPALTPATAIHGCDYNRDAVAWCRDHLPFARVDVNDLRPPLPYAAGAFDLVYAFSVFTHLTEELQAAWLAELGRVLKPGGVAWITLHGESVRHLMSPREQAAFRAGRPIVRYSGIAGSNLCAAFHPEAWVRGTLARGWRILSYSPSALGQDILLVQRPSDTVGST